MGAAFLVLVGPTSPIIAFDMPHRDAEGWCEKSTLRMPDWQRAAARHDCIDREQAAYERLKGEWPLASEEEQRESLSRNVGAPDSYKSLEAVLGSIVGRDEARQRLQEQQQPNHFKFD